MLAEFKQEVKLIPSQLMANWSGVVLMPECFQFCSVVSTVLTENGKQLAVEVSSPTGPIFIWTFLSRIIYLLGSYETIYYHIMVLDC